MSKTSYQRTEWFKSNSNSKNTWHYHDIWPKTWYYHDKCLKHHGTLIVLNNYHIHIYMIHDKKHGSTIIYVHKNSLIMDACRVMQVSGLDSCWRCFLADLDMEEWNQIRTGKPPSPALHSQSRWNRLCKQTSCKWKIQFTNSAESVFVEKTFSQD